jgi:hypothetical protein
VRLKFRVRVRDRVRIDDDDVSYKNDDKNGTLMNR